jgi:hypothetical protein
MPNNILRPFLIAFLNLILLGTMCSQTADHAPAAMPALTPAPSNEQGRVETVTKGDSITGEWIVRFTVENHTAAGKMSLHLEGEKLTGSLETAHTGPGTIQDGKWIDRKLTATLVFERHESIVLMGGFQADTNQKLGGEFRTEGRTGKWDAERPTAPQSATGK